MTTYTATIEQEFEDRPDCQHCHRIAWNPGRGRICGLNRELKCPKLGCHPDCPFKKKEEAK